MALRLSLRGLARVSAIAFCLPALQACYSYVPIDSQQPAPAGRYVEMQITDRGRVGLGDRFGSGVRKINGTVLSQQGDNVVLSVDLVTNIDGDLSRWSGDTAQIDRTFVGGMNERRFSSGRTSLLAVGVGAVVYATFASGLLGGGSDPDEEPTGPVNQSNRIPSKPHFSRDLQVRLWRILVP